MKKYLIFLTLFLVLSDTLFSQTIKTVGTGGNYGRLKLAFDAIDNGNITGDIVLQIINNCTETATAVLHESGYGGVSSYTSVKIYPTVSGKTISGSVAGPLIDFHGAQNVTIDGRVNQTGSADLIISNTNSGTSSSTIRFIEDANNNTITYSTIKGSETSSTSGIILFSTTTVSTGNDNNTISNNSITSAGINRPVNAIFSLGTASMENSGNIISNNNFYDFFNKSYSSNGILISSNSTTWTITNNSFYETASFTSLTDGVSYTVISIDNSSGIGFVISTNYIGGNVAFCGGSAFTKTNDTDNPFTAISLNAGTATANSIQNNTISNISWSNSLSSPWNGIMISAGDANIGTTTGNTIGSGTGTGSVTVTNAQSGSVIYGINIQSSGNVDCENNVIGAITTSNLNSNESDFYGINKDAVAGTTIINNNSIGSSSTANSILANSLSNGSAQHLVGINNSGTGSITINNNIISNLTNNTSDTDPGITGFIDGIRSSDGNNTISGNTIKNLSIANANSSADNNASVCGISLTGTTLKTITGNTISSLINTYSSFAGNITGIYFTGNTGANTINKNFINSLSVTGASSISASIYGIQVSSGAATYANNIISLGGNTQTTIYGIYETGAAGNDNNLYFNTVYINGTPTAGSGNSYALYSAVTTNTRNFRNNIFDNARSNSGATGKHYAIYLATATGATIDYNDYYTPGNGGTTGFLGGDIADLASWKTATSQDVHSFSTDPAFPGAGGTNASGYIPVTSLPGVSGTGITTDYNGAARVSTPTMGAFEGGSCSNPTDGGNLSAAQNGCSPFDPTPFSGTTPTGFKGSSLEYQWQKSTTASSGPFSDIPGANLETFDEGPLTVTTWYKRLSRVSCTGTWTGAAESTVTEATVNQLPNTGLVVGGSGSVCSGSGTNITLSSSESGVNYQLRNVTVPVGTAQAGNGSTLTFSTGNLTSTTTFNILATNATTSCTAQLTQTATVTVNALPNKSLSVGGAGFVCSGTGTNITVGLSETGVNYQLRNGVTNIGSPVAGNGGTIDLPTDNMTFNVAFNVLAINASSSCSVQLTQTATVSVNPIPNSGLTVGGTSSICNGTGTNITVALSETGVNYQLRIGTGNIGSPLSGTGGTITFATGTLTSTTTYNILATYASTGCNTQLTQTATITVDPVSVGGTVSGSSPITYGSSTGTMTLSSYSGIIQRWEKRFNSGSWITVSNTSPTYSETPSTAGTWGYRAVVKSGVCSEANSSEFIVTVNQAPLTVTAVDKSKTYDGLVYSPFSVTYSGFVNGETAAVLGGTLVFSGTASTATNAGTYGITPGGLTSSNYNITYINGQLIINKANPVLTWSNPADIVQGTALSTTQLNTTANVPGTFIFTPAAGVILSAGPNQSLSVSFTPDDALNYNNANKSVMINVMTITAIKDVMQRMVSVYPNPAEGKITINGLSSVPNDKTYTIVISDNSGQIMIHKILERNVNSETIDISKYADGVYYIVLQSDKEKIVKRFVKQ